jgi:PhzF family phenazine biosynthesis protein
MKLYQIDSFTKERFKGNPAAVCIVEGELTQKQMQLLAMEMNLSETAYVKIGEASCDLRWFTPASEVPLCGHATLATAFVLFEKGYWPKDKTIQFNSFSGPLYVSYVGGMLSMDFPANKPSANADLVSEMNGLFDIDLEQVLTVSGEMIFIFKSEEALLNFDPEDQKVAKLAKNGLITSAKSSNANYDFVSRYFAPNLGIKEDPVTGFMHTILTPYWAELMEKSTFNARQASARGGEMQIELKGGRVVLKGHAVSVFETEIEL